MTTFAKYNSIDNAYQQKVVNAIVSKGHSDGDWVVLEKAHGANVMFIVDKNSVMYGKRTSLLTNAEAEKFYNSLEVFKRYSPCALELWKLLGHPGPIIIYGELIGGCYLGMERSTPSTVTVQNGVAYCPHNEFYAFDIRIVGEDTVYLNHDQCTELFKKCGFIYAQELFRGPFTEVLVWSKEHNADQTTIPDLFGLPPIADNIREGHVLKPVVPQVMPNGCRVILKDKNDRFSEKAHKPRQPRATPNKSDDLQSAIDDALNYITDTRLDNVLSKEGSEINRKTVGRLMGLLVRDAVKDWEKDWDGPPLKKEEQKILNKELTNSARGVVLKRM